MRARVRRVASVVASVKWTAAFGAPSAARRDRRGAHSIANVTPPSPVGAQDRFYNTPIRPHLHVGTDARRGALIDCGTATRSNTCSPATACLTAGDSFKALPRGRRLTRTTPPDGRSRLTRALSRLTRDLCPVTGNH